MKARIKGLDGLRAIAVSLVFIEHFVLFGYSLGGLGVRIFFVLSGFLIIGILQNQRIAIEANKSTIKIEFIKFWSRRVRRIVPVYYLVLILLTLYFLHRGESINTQGLIWYYLFAGNWYIEFISHSYGTFSHLWSISVEQHFYLLSAPLLLLVTVKKHKAVLLGLIAVSFSVFTYNLLSGALPRNNYLSSFVNFSYMAAGGLLAITSIRPIFNKYIGWAAVIGCTMFLVTAYFKEFRNTYPLAYPIINFLICYLGCVSLIKYVSSEPNSLIVKVLEWTPLRELGVISYGFYVFHHFSPNVPHFISSSLVISIWPVFQFGLAVFASWLSWNFFEKRFLQPRLPKERPINTNIPA